MTDVRPDESESADNPVLPATGDPAVDAVLAEIAHVHAKPLEEHPGIFERAHEQLRAALDSPRS